MLITLEWFMYPLSVVVAYFVGDCYDRWERRHIKEEQG